MSSNIKISVKKTQEFTKQEQKYRMEARRKVSMENNRLKSV